MPRGKPANQQAMLERDARIWHMRTYKQMTYQRIADTEQLPLSTVVSCVKRVADMRREHLVDDVETRRAADVEAMDAMIDRLRKQYASEPDAQTANTLLRYMESRRKLLGLDAPERSEVQHTITSPVDDELEELARELGLSETIPSGVTVSE